MLQDTVPFYGYNHEHEKESWLKTYKPLITKKYRELFLRDPVTELIQSCHRSFSNKYFYCSRSDGTGHRLKQRLASRRTQSGPGTFRGPTSESQTGTELLRKSCKRYFEEKTLKFHAIFNGMIYRTVAEFKQFITFSSIRHHSFME